MAPRWASHQLPVFGPPMPAVPYRTITPDQRLNEHWPPANLLDRIRLIVTSNEPPQQRPVFTFNSSPEAAQSNFEVLQSFDLDLNKAITAMSDTPVGYGSEFRKPQILQYLFKSHPAWERMHHILTHGSTWPAHPANEKQCALDFNTALAFGNHKGATTHNEALIALVEKDITHGYALPLPLNKLHHIPGAHLAPLNVQLQNTINERGEIITKDGSYNSSVNSRINNDGLMPCLFGFAIRRIINWAVAARHQRPTSRILASKINFKSAYRRCHINACTALQACTHIPRSNLATVALRLTFRGKPGPNEWGCLAEQICDLTNTLLHHPDWDPSTLSSPTATLIPKTQPLPDDIPFAPGGELIVDLDPDDCSFTDINIDDLVGLTIHITGSHNLSKLQNAALLAIHCVARPLRDDKPILREKMAALNKLTAEAGLTERKIILGWAFDFRQMTIALPTEKYKMWQHDCNEMPNAGRTTNTQLEQNIGRWVNSSNIIPHANHFTSRLRGLILRKPNNHPIIIPQTCKDDITLMSFFIEQAHDGIDLRFLAYLAPTRVYRSDTCPHGIGGYSSQGRAWRWHIPPHLLFRASNNMLKYLASITGPWIDIIERTIQCGDCVLPMTDSTTSGGWSRKTSFREENENNIQAAARIKLARHCVRLYNWGTVNVLSVPMDTA